MSALFRLLSLLAAAAIGGLFVLWFGHGGAAGTAGQTPADAPAPSAPPPAAFAATARDLVAVTEMPAAERIRLGGTVEPQRLVRLTAQAPGRITFVAGDEGTRVGSGEVVVGIDDDALAPQYRAAWADLGQQMAALQNAQTQLYQNLYGPSTSPMGGPGYAAYEQATAPLYNFAQGFARMMPGLSGPGSPFSGPIMTQSQSQHSFAAASAARYDYERQLATLAAAQSRIDTLDAQARDRRAVAPWAGAILARHVRVGDVVQPGQPLADFGDVDNLVIRIDVPVALVANLHPGDPVPVTVGGTNIWAPVAQIFPAADDKAHTVTVKLSVPADSALAPGMFALAWIAQPGGGSPSQLAPAIPTAAIARRGSLPVAFVADPQGKVEMRILRTGDRQGDRTAVLSGLRPGEMVVADPTPALRSGDTLGARP